MELFDAMEKRHSFRGSFRNQPVPRNDLEKIVDSGIRAPSGYNAQTTSFVIVDDSDIVRSIGVVIGSANMSEAPSAIVLCVDTRSEEGKYHFGIQDCAAACENILLAVTALGYASVWIEGTLLREDRASSIAELLSVPVTHRVQVVLPIGVPDTPGKQKEKTPFTERAWFNSFGG